jgi:thiol-disulfide isomerase/thioredoxin
MSPSAPRGDRDVESVTAVDFAEGRLLRPGVWAVAFVADWCPFCRSFLGPFSALRGSGPFEIAFGDVSDEGSPLWDDFQIEVVPTVIGFRDGRAAYRRDGVRGVGLGDADLVALRKAVTDLAERAP